MIKAGLMLMLLLSPLLAQRIIALSPAINEILFALGKGGDIVGNIAYCDYPKAAQRIPKVGDYFSISLERILQQKPDLVIMGKNNLPLKPKLHTLGIQTLDIASTSLNALQDSILNIGTHTNSSNKANALVKEIQSALQKSQGILKEKKILIVFGNNPDPKSGIYVSGNHLYFADIICASGNQNAYKGKYNRQPILSLEGLMATDADIIIILSPRTAKTKNKSTTQLLSAWYTLPIPAARYKTIYLMQEPYAGIPSQRVSLFIQDFIKVLSDAKDKLPRL